MTGGQPQAERYDVAVVGAGLGGLSAAASLAGVGKRVVVIDRQDGPGGYAHAFTRGPYTFDPAVHVTGQGRPGQFLHSYLHLLGVAQEATLLPLDQMYAADYPGMRLHAPSGLEEFVAAHARHFPHEAEGIASFMRLGAQVTQESQQLSPRLSLRELDEAARRFPTLFRYRTAMLDAVLGEHLKDPRAKAAMASMWPYIGVTPSQVSFVGFCSILIGMLEGLVYCQGSFQRLADAFVGVVRRSGGDVVLGREVTRIAVADGRVAGVVLDDGTRVQADAVVSNADARLTLEQLVGTEHLPDKYARSLARMKPSLSAFVLYVATDLDVTEYDIGHELFLFDHWDHDATYADIMAGKVGGMWVSLPTIIDPSLAPEGDHLVICSTLAPYDIGVAWQTEGAQRYEQSMLDIIEKRLLPGFRDRIKFSERATPLTFERYTLNHRGAIYGWDHIPSQSTPKRLPHHTPVDGLWLAGHWTEPGCTSFRVIYSGFQTAQLMLGLEDPGQLMEKLAQQPAGSR